MQIKQNLHVHCTYCDGKDTPEEVLESAIEQGFDSIGFSSHSVIYMPRYNTDGKYPNRYREHINRLKKEYADRIKVFLGIEIEITNDFYDLDEYDYLIGTVHYFNLDGKIVGFDRSAETVKSVIDEHFGGDGLKFAKKYYEDLARLPEYADFDIIGHFDILTKNIEKADLFDTTSKEYRPASKVRPSRTLVASKVSWVSKGA